MSIGNRFPQYFEAANAGTRNKSLASCLQPDRYIIGRLVDGHPDFAEDVIGIEGIKAVQALNPSEELWSLSYLGHNLALDRTARTAVPDYEKLEKILAIREAPFPAMRSEIAVDVAKVQYEVSGGPALKKLWFNPKVPLYSAAVTAKLGPGSSARANAEYIALRKKVGLSYEKLNTKGPNGLRMSSFLVLQVVGVEEVLRSEKTSCELLQIAKPAVGRWTLGAVGRHKMPTNH